MIPLKVRIYGLDDDHGLKLKIKRLRDFLQNIAIFQNIQYNTIQIFHTMRITIRQIAVFKVEFELKV